MRKRELVRAYKSISKKLDKLQVKGSRYISRRDNNIVFELVYFFRELAERIDNKYDVEEVIEKMKTL